MAIDFENIKGWTSDFILKAGLECLLELLPEKTALDIMENCFFVCLKTLKTADLPGQGEADKGAFWTADRVNGRHLIVIGDRSILEGNMVAADVAFHEMGHYVKGHKMGGEISPKRAAEQEDEANDWASQWLQ